MHRFFICDDVEDDEGVVVDPGVESVRWTPISPGIDMCGGCVET